MAAAARFFFLLTVLATASVQQATAATFTLINSCDYTVWPGITENLSMTGFELQVGQSVTLDVPAVWMGRIWGRTDCNFDKSGHGKCATGDCGGTLACNNSGMPPATLVEFTLGKQDFYDVSVVDGFNLPLMVSAKGGQGACAATGCLADLNRYCPKELQVAGSVACKGPCVAFGSSQYCCTGQFSDRKACKPSTYSQMFKNACPRSYSYPYDDASLTFTCSGADYVITFCQAITGQKRSSTPATTNARISSSNNNNADDDPSSSNVAWDVNTTGLVSASSSSSSSSSTIAFFFGTLLLLLLCCC